MDEIAFFITLLQEYDGLETTTLYQLSESSAEEGCLVYYIRHADGTDWVARAYQRDRPLPDWFRFFYPWVKQDIAEWLLTRAATLLCLELQNYPAPRVLRTRAGALMSQTPEWCMLITTFIQGTVLQPTLEQLYLLGETLGSLHALSTSKLSSNAFSPGNPIGMLNMRFPQFRPTSYLLSTDCQQSGEISMQSSPKPLSVLSSVLPSPRQ